ncbi:MAG: VanW family protein [Acidimicrobiales bacterium]
MDESLTETSPDAPSVPGATSTRPAPAHFGAASRHAPRRVEPDDEPRRRRRWILPLLVLPAVVAGLVVVAWAVDTSLGGVPRNVRLADTDIGGLSEAELATRVADLAATFEDTPVQLVTEDASYDTTARDIGLMVDAERTAEEALDVDGKGFVVGRPVGWLTSFVTPREASLVVRVSDERVAATTLALEGDARTPPVEPTIELDEGTFRVVPGEDGIGLDPREVAELLVRAAEETGPGETITVRVERGPIPPLGNVEEARAAASDAEDLVDEPLEVETPGGARTIEPEVLRTWAALASRPNGSVVAVLDPARVAEGLRTAFADIEGHPVDARFTLDGGRPVIIPDRPGTVCCADGSADVIEATLRDGGRRVALELTEGPARFTAADAQAWGITQAVGGNHAWRSGAPTTAGPGFTTYHSAGGNRVQNIHRIADLVRGAVIPPGGSFSVNDHVGKRTAEKGFLPAGAIRDGEHVDEIGGGVSQFATTTFNAAYFAGLDIVESQAHSEYFDRYPRGREATMGFPAPDLVIANDTPYGVLIWTSYTDTSLTVTLYSSPHATAEQTGISEASSGRCRVVTTTRTRTYPDGHTEEDKFRATYRPGAGQSC